MGGEQWHSWLGTVPQDKVMGSIADGAIAIFWVT
jgi:hypothetical protein